MADTRKTGVIVTNSKLIPPQNFLERTAAGSQQESSSPNTKKALEEMPNHTSDPMSGTLPEVQSHQKPLSGLLLSRLAEESVLDTVLSPQNDAMHPPSDDLQDHTQRSFFSN